MKKKIAAILMVFALVCSMFCSAGNVQAKETVKLSQKKLTLKVGEKKKLKVKGTKKKVKWSSNKKKVATVSKKGVVKAKKKGKAVITARVGKKKYNCKVTVNNPKKPTASSSPNNTQPTVPTTQSPVSTQTPDTQNTAVPSPGVSERPGQTAAPTPVPTSTGEPLQPDSTVSPAPTSAPTSSGEPSEDDDPIPGYAAEAPGEGPASASNIISMKGVPLVTLNNGVQMPRFGLGTQIQSLENGDLGILNETSRKSVVAALQAGYRHLDTAHGYLNERGVGQGIIDSGVPREEIWLTSKLWPSEFGDAYNAINDMLDRLQVEYLDLVYLHHPAGDIETIVSAWRDLERAYREGKIRALGISNFDNRMNAFNAIMEEEIKPQIMQIECHPFAQRLETRELAKQYNIQVECWYPLGHGDQRLLNADTLDAIAAAHDKSVVQIIIRWHIQEGFSAIPGSTNPAHIQENIDIFDFELSEEEMEQIRAMDQGERGRYFNLNYEFMGGMFTNPPREWNGE